MQPPRSSEEKDTASSRPFTGLNDDDRSPRDYVELAQTALEKGNVGKAIEMIERGQTRLLDRSVALNHTTDPISDDTIMILSNAKQALLAKDRTQAMGLLNSALSSLR